MAFQILDPAEIEFPFEDVTLFKGLEEAGELLTERDAPARGYIEQLNLFTEDLKKSCRGMHIDFQRFSSGDPLDVSLQPVFSNTIGQYEVEIKMQPRGGHKSRRERRRELNEFI